VKIAETLVPSGIMRELWVDCGIRTIMPVSLIMLIILISLNILFINNEIKKNLINIKVFANQ